jgi:Flp pilus assembly protein TadD
MIPEGKPYSAGISGWRAFLLLGLSLFLIYSNTFSVPWHLDDIHNILANQKVHAKYPHLASVLEPFASLYQDGQLKRPLALTTFALNWYVGKDDPFGYHAVNLAIHIMTAHFLFLTLLSLFKSPRLDGIFSRQQVYFISLLATALWALNPIQVQAVTYIVQRMASLCGMFYIMSIYFYLNARSAEILSRKSVLLFIACCMSFLAAFLTKENAALLPVTLLLIEAVFFQDMGRKTVRRTLFGIALVLLISMVIGGSLVFYRGDPSAVLKYDTRFFSPMERLLTQPRILLLYLTLVFYPAPNRLSLVHDIEISTSFWHPWATLPAFIIVSALIGLAIFKLKKWPIMTFAVLFFFLNHAIESSIIPLELVFEHRNYLPSMFLFWPVAVGLERLINIYRNRNAVVYYGLLAFIPLLLVGMGAGTYIRNIDWTSEKYLWEDAMRKAPRASRPIHMLAWTHYERIGDHKTAMALYRKALNGEKYNIVTEPRIWNNIAAIYHLRGDFEQAAQYWGKSVASATPKVDRRFRLRLALTLIRLNRLDEAESELNLILTRTPDFVKAMNLRGIILLNRQRPRDALALLRQCIRLEPRNGRLLINIGACFYALGDYQRANLFFSEALRRTSRLRIALLWSIKNQLKLRNGKILDADLEDLISRAPADKIIKWLHKCFSYKIYKDDILAPQQDDQLIDRIKAQYIRKLDQMGE